MRRGKPAVIADRDPPQSVVAYAAAESALLRRIGRDFDFRRVPVGWQRTNGRGSGEGRVLPVPPFGGEEQLGNAAACAAVVDCLAHELPVNDDALAKGIRNAYLRGRFERATVDGAEWIFDVAHNPAAAAILAASLSRLPSAPRTLAVFAAMRDKDLAGVIAPLVPSVDAWFVTQADAERGASGEQLREVLAAAGARSIEVASDVVAATAAARAAAQQRARVIVFGSFVTVGAAADALGLYCAPSRMADQPARWTRA
jgi:dihydrofolate synthase/folylpolyglutamate synthase